VPRSRHCRDAALAAGIERIPQLVSAGSVGESNEFLAELQAEFSVKAIVARDWMPDDMLADGYHLTVPGATAFTKRLATFLAP